jgi:methionyl aminopeptidase
MKTSRNELCWCGSGKKYKRCHLLKDQLNSSPRRNSGRGVIIKTEEQIEGIRRSGQLTKKLLDMVEERIQPGTTTDEINFWVHEETMANGAYPAPLNYRGKSSIRFPKSVCTSVNEVVCHGIPGPQVLQEGDIINVDVTSILDGYYGDASRMFFIGEVSEEAKRLVEVTKECLNLGIKQVKPLKTTGDIGHAIQSYAEGLGYSVVRDFAGHGVGIEFHEEPQILHYGEPNTGVTLQKNMVFTIEPMINIGRAECKILRDGWTAVTSDGSLSAQWEHTIRVTDTGVEILTA